MAGTAVYVANATATVSSIAQNIFICNGQLNLANVSNITYTQGSGAVLNFTGLTQTQIAPYWCSAQSANVQGVSSYAYRIHNNGIVPNSNSNVSIVTGVNANIANCSLQIFANGNLSTEIATGNLPAAVINDVIEFMGFFHR